MNSSTDKRKLFSCLARDEDLWTPYLAATSSNGVSINAPMALVQFLYDNVTPILSGFKQRREQTRQPSSDCARRSLPEEAEKQSLPPGFGHLLLLLLLFYSRIVI